MTKRAGDTGTVGGTVAEEGAIYCRMSHVKDMDQTGVDRQERICREIADRLGVRVAPEHVFVDNSRSAWRRKRRRPGWDGLLAAVRGGRVRHVLAYHPDRLMRQPWDLEELLRLADEHALTLHGQANARDLNDADDRFMLRIEVAHACRSSDDTSRRVRTASEEAAAQGRPHGGRRAFGYEASGTAIVEAEAQIVREIYRRFLSGEAFAAIATTLNERGVVSATGRAWGPAQVRSLIDSPRHAGLRVHHGQPHRDTDGAYVKGTWKGIVGVGEWREAQRLRTARSLDFADKRRAYRPYLLRGLVVCGACGRTMGGSCSNGYATYSCAQRTGTRPQACGRRVGADRLERFVTDAAIELLSRLDVADLRDAAATATAATDTRQAEVAEDTARLEELSAIWIAKELPTAEYRTMRAAVAARIAKAQRATVVRPLTALTDVATGPGARAAWEGLPLERRAAVLRFLFAAVRIGESTVRGGRFDYSRIEIEQQPHH